MMGLEYPIIRRKRFPLTLEPAPVAPGAAARVVAREPELAQERTGAGLPPSLAFPTAAVSALAPVAPRIVGDVPAVKPKRSHHKKRGGEDG